MVCGIAWKTLDIFRIFPAYRHDISDLLGSLKLSGAMNPW